MVDDVLGNLNKKKFDPHREGVYFPVCPGKILVFPLTKEREGSWEVPLDLARIQIVTILFFRTNRRSLKELQEGYKQNDNK